MVKRKNRKTIPKKDIGTKQIKGRFGKDLLCVLILVIICLAVGLPRYRLGIDFMDEGFLAYGAVRVIEGQVPNLNFVSLQPPLSFYTAAAMFKLFGTSLVSLRILGLCIYILIPLLIYAISRNMTGQALSFAAAVPATVLGIPLFNFVPFAVWQGITATLAAAYFFMRATVTSKYYWAFPAGLMTAASILLRHDQGFYLAISILAYTIALKFANDGLVAKPELKSLSGIWAAGIIVVMLPLGIYWFACGALPNMIKQLIVFPLTTYSKTSSLLFPTFNSDLTFNRNLMTGFFYFPPVIEIIAAIRLLKVIVHRSFDFKEAHTAFILVWSALFYCQVLTRSDTHHLMITLPPFFILCACCLQAFLKAIGDAVEKTTQRLSAPLTAKSIVAVVIGAMATGFLLSTAPLLLASPKGSLETIHIERAGVQVKSADILEDYVRIVQKYAATDRSILVLPYNPMFYFLCERRNPTQWNYLWPGDQTPEEHQILIRQAKSDPPAIVLVAGESDVKIYAPAIIDYVHTEYRVAHNFGGLLFYLPLKDSAVVK